jgi:hypothetical protein
MPQNDGDGEACVHGSRMHKLCLLHLADYLIKHMAKQQQVLAASVDGM